MRATLQAGASRLAELEYFLPGGAPSARSGKLGAGAGYDAEAKVRALWVWDLSADLSLTPQGSAGRCAGKGRGVGQRVCGALWLAGGRWATALRFTAVGGRCPCAPRTAGARGG